MMMHRNANWMGLSAKGGRMSRRALLTACAGLALALSAAAPGLAQNLPVLKVGKVGNDFTFFAADFGKAKGIYQKHGVDLEIFEIGGAQIVQTMITGNTDIGLMGGTQLQHVAVGVPIKGVGALSNAPYGFVLVVPANGKISTMADLKGKTISVSRARSLTEWVASNVAINQGWPVSDLNFVGVGGDAERVAAMLTGSVDAALVSLETAFPLEAAGQVEILVNFGEIIPDFHNQLIFASDPVIEQRQDDLRNFLAGWYETVAYMRANRDEVIDAYVDYTQIDRASVETVFDSLMDVPYLSEDGKFNTHAVELMDAMFVDYQMIPASFPTADYYTEDFLG
jgi:NitT/TauT family transport system substrate-binding protein